MEIDNRISGKSKLAGLIGNPIGHSISPQLHNTISRNLGIDMVYVPFKVEKNDLENAVKGLKAVNITGFNVTIPYKKDIMKYIDVNSKEALLMGAVNTVKNIDGRLYGYNTDAEGFARSFKEAAGTGFKNKKVVLIGAGGTARAIAVKIAMEGAAKIHIVNRTVSKASEIAEIVNNNIGHMCEFSEPDTAEETGVFELGDIIINTTSLGMYPDIYKNPVGELVKFSSNQIVYDVIYNPEKTKLLEDAEKFGCKAINGLGMLLYQGIYAYEIWTGIKVPEELIKQIFISFTNILRD